MCVCACIHQLQGSEVVKLSHETRGHENRGEASKHCNSKTGTNRLEHDNFNHFLFGGLLKLWLNCGIVAWQSSAA
eukprot:1791924-Amphidinium_carterae.2